MANENILVVDDEEDILELVRYNLQREGYHVLCSKSGEEALDLAQSEQPDLIVLDEPVSALDVAIQAQLLNLFRRLKDKLSLTYVFISHDLGVVHYLCDHIAVSMIVRL